MSETTYEGLWDCANCSRKEIGAVTHKVCPGCGNVQSGKIYPPKRHQRVAAVDPGRGPDWVCDHCGARNPAMSQSCSAGTNGTHGCGAQKGSSKSAPIAPTRFTNPQAVKPKLTVATPVVPKAPTPPVIARPIAPTPPAAPRLPPRPRPQIVWDLDETIESSSRRTPPPQASHDVVGTSMAQNSIITNPVTWAIVGGVAFLAMIVTCATYRTNAEVEVVGHTWKRSVLMERLEQRQDTTWCDNLPSGATTIGRPVQEIRTTTRQQVGENCHTTPAHYEPPPPCDKTPRCTPADMSQCVEVDNGNGTFTEKCPDPVCTTPKCPEGRQVPAKKECTPNYVDVPVFGTKCTYAVLTWTRRPSWETTTGNDQNPYWPDLTKYRICSGQEKENCERENQRTESYVVHFRDEHGQQFDCSYTENPWRTYLPGTTWITKESITGAADCGMMKRIGS